LDNALGPTAYTYDETQREQIFQHFHFNLLRMVDIARSVGARVIFVAPASNLREVSPFKSEHRKTLSQEDRERWKVWYDRAREDYANPVPTNALAALAAAAAIDDLPANLHFVRGRVLEKLGRFGEAKTAYERARDQDVCPLRAPSAISRILTEVAAERQVPLIDHQALVDAKSEHGISGAGMFLDHVHPTVEGYRLLALEILKTMDKEGIVRADWDPAIIQRTTDRVLARIDSRSHSLALMNLCKTLGWAGKREEAYRAGARAVELGGNIPEVRYEAGLAAELSGRTNEAIGHFRRAVALKPTLGEAHCALGVLLEDGGRFPEAVAEYRLALEYGLPRNAERDQSNLSRARQKLQAASTGR
jgi:tetratricopeptide (TPR) repeat protein